MRNNINRPSAHRVLSRSSAPTFYLYCSLFTVMDAISERRNGGCHSIVQMACEENDVCVLGHDFRLLCLANAACGMACGIES